MEMGFPKEWCEIALAKCANNVEAAINFCFEHSSDMERLLAQYKATKEGGESDLLHRRDDKDVVPLLEQLSEMGFPAHWCKKALAANRNNVDAALTWILSNGEILEAEDRREEISKTQGSNDQVETEDKCTFSLGPNPLRLVSGQASINESTLMVEGLVGGGFASVGAPDCMVSSGRWYYEAVLHTNGCIQIGWADTAFCGAADRGDGVGDGPHSWAYDGWRQQKWHGQSSPWGSKWNQGDVVGCGVDADSGAIIFTLNGKMRSVNMGVAFRSIDFIGGLYPCASFNRRERLQFNLGSKPFKYPPPPGFKPMLEALTTYVHELHVPIETIKGFGVIGLREDALEEAIGDENYFSEGRYFNRDSHMPTMLRGSAGHTRSSAAAGSIKSDVLAELKSISDDRIYMELLLISRSLAILHARRTVLTLLAKWPTSHVGPFTLSSLVKPDQASKSVSEASLLLEFVKLVAGSTGQSAIASPVSPSGISEDVDIGLLLSTGGASGRQLLSLLACSMRSALQLDSRSDCEGNTSTQSLMEVFLTTIQSEVRRVAERQYSRVPWDSSDSAISACLLQISSESGAPWSDKEILNHPNIFLAEWLTKLMMERISSTFTDEPACKNDSVRRRLLSSWVVSLRSPSMCVKQRGMAIIAGILQDLLSTVYVEQDAGSKDILTKVLEDLPVKRLVILTEERLQKEYSNFPVCSKYLQSLVELVSTIALGITAVGSCMLKYFYTDLEAVLASCKALKRDLYSGDLEEYENVKRAEEESITQPENDPSTDMSPSENSGVDKAENDQTHVESDHRGNTSMEIDNSDSEDVPGITLSAIANMVAEDSDVVSAAAAIAAAANTRLTVRRQVALKELQQPKQTEHFKYVFPETELPIDVQDLSEEECIRIEAAKEGIRGNESATWPYGFERGVLSDHYAEIWSGTITQYRLNNSPQNDQIAELKVGSRVIRGPDWKWRDQDGGEGSIGIVEGISPWSGVDGEGMSVRWPSDAVYTYRWGSDGNYDLTHVEVDDEGNIVKKYPVLKPKYDDDGTFGAELHLGVLLHLTEQDGVDGSDRRKVSGVMEWPDYNAASSVVGWRCKDGSLCLQELQLLRGSTDMGWQLRFGTEKWQPGTKYNLKVEENGTGENLAGMFSYPALKKDVIVENRGEIRISNQHLFKMDPHHHFPTLSISEDGMSVTCMNGDTRNLALGTVGFATGVYYWEVRVDQAEFGSVFLGVCEKPGPPGSHNALSSRLNRWNGWGFVNFRASYHNSTERIYGDHFNAGDTIGVRLDMEQGKLSFFMDGIKYGEHIVTDLGVAFENIKGDRNTKTLYPCIGMRKGGDRVCLNGKWIALPGIPPKHLLLDAIDVDAQLHAWFLSMNSMVECPRITLSENVLRESWTLWKRWCENRWERYPVRPRGVIVDFDTYPSTCIQVCKKAGLHAPFLAGDRVRICSKVSGVMEWPDYNAASSVVGWRCKDGSLCLQELQLLRGSTDMGWQLRFGTEKWQPGTKYNLKVEENGTGENLAGMFSYPALKKDVIVENRGEIRISNQHLFKMDPHHHFPTLSISEDGMSVTCMNGDTRNLALGTVGFATGVYYWEVRVDQAEFGSVFLGVCEKPGPPGSHNALSSRLNRWNGWGFVNFRASYHNSTERIYGDHFNAGDTIGVRLDMEQGKLSFFMDGIKYGEHIVTDLGVAFENIKGDRNTKTLYPCIGMRKGGDRVCLNGKWIALPGIPPKHLLLDAIDVDAQLHAWFLSMNSMVECPRITLSENVLRESWTLWKRWCENRWERYPVRPRGVIVDFDTYPSTCIQVCKKAGLHAPFLAGDRVRICSKGGRELDQPEEAIILGVHRGHIWYRTETQGNEGAEEGRSWAWYFSTMELMELILVKRGGKDPEEIDFDHIDGSGSESFTGRTREEALASTSFSTFMELATAKHTAQSDMQLVERLNEFCGTMGLDIANLKIADVSSPEEQNIEKENLEVITRPRTQSFMNSFSSSLLNSLSGPELRARCAVLRVLNSKILRVLSLICIQPTETSNATIELIKSSESKTSRSGSHYSSWQYPSASLKLRSLRQLIFTSTKRSFWESLLRATTTPTPLPSDEYEDPREIRVIRINRIQAQPSKLSLLAQPDDRLRRSVFGQLYREMRTWTDSSFRRAYCGKGHGGQRRAFKVKFLGEGVNDYGGPYRAVFEQVVDELQLDNVELSKGEQGLLPLLIPCPNRRSGTGSNQDKFLLNPSCGISLQSNAPMALELYRFLGKLIGTAVRHGLQMGLNLPSLVWRPIAGLEIGRPHLESVDVVATNNLMYVEECPSQDAKETLEHLTFSTPLSDGNEVPLCPGGEKVPVTYENRLTYVHLVEQARLTESAQQLAALRNGLATVLPMEAAALFTSRELETLICGRREVDVELLRQCTEYDTGVEESMPHVKHFWEVLTEMTNEERTSFLRFVWARSRMPNSAKDFPMNFKIQTAHGQSSQEDPDKYLPHAQTCFFSLSLPAYTSKEILRSKLLYAIQNSPNMDADVRLHNAEGWADA
ncbi:hypothetical protein ABG067_003531 [Albugo candida]